MPKEPNQFSKINDFCKKPPVSPTKIIQKYESRSTEREISEIQNNGSNLNLGEG